MFVFHKKYFISTVILFVTEIAIAVFVRDRFIRPYVGDVLVVILVYCFLRAFFRISVLPACITALLIAFAAELGQYFHLTRLLRIENNKVASGFFGNSFDWSDLLAYLCGIMIVVLVEYLIAKNLPPSSKRRVQL